MAWAAGITGVTLFITRNFLESEKKIRCPIHADYRCGDDTFGRTMGTLLGPPLLEGNEITILRNGDEIYPAMLEAIESAEHSITMENFLWTEGMLTHVFAQALAAKSRAGVKVHVLQDALGCDGLRGPSLNLLREAPVELEIFRFANLLQMNFRTHRKLLVVDGRTGFIGGAGIADPWLGDGRTRGHWRDNHYRVRGPTVGQMQHAFMDNWMQTRAQVLHGDIYFPAITEHGEMRSQVFKSSNSEGADSARMMLLLSIAAARRHIRIANAYFIPDDLCRQTLVEACQRGVKVEIITPGPDIDAQTIRLVGQTRWKPLLEAGARFYEYLPARFHCKYFLVDECWASVGSANFDNRSLRLNEEANLNVLDTEFLPAASSRFLRRTRRVRARSRWRTGSAGRCRSASLATPRPSSVLNCSHGRGPGAPSRRHLQRPQLRRHRRPAVGEADRRGHCRARRGRRRLAGARPEPETQCRR